MAKKIYTRKRLVQAANLVRSKIAGVNIHLNEGGKWAITFPPPMQRLDRVVGSAKATYEYLMGLYHGAAIGSSVSKMQLF